MANIFPPGKVYVSDSKIPNAQRGVFAAKNIKMGEIIEICPIIEIPSHQTPEVINGELRNYVYFFGPKKEKMLLALGFGSIYNHSQAANAIYIIKPKEKTIQFVAGHEIKKNEEITVNYVQGSRTSNPLWFVK
jgi:SET domain-containing protein